MVCLSLYKISTKLFLLKINVINLNQDLYIITYKGSVFYYKLATLTFYIMKLPSWNKNRKRRLIQSIVLLPARPGLHNSAMSES